MNECAWDQISVQDICERAGIGGRRSTCVAPGGRDRWSAVSTSCANRFACDRRTLATADVSVAMGTGTDVVMSSAQVTLVKADPRGVARARAISRTTVRNMKQNLGFAFLYNAIGVPVAAGVLYPAFGILLTP